MSESHEELQYFYLCIVKIAIDPPQVLATETKIYAQVVLRTRTAQSNPIKYGVAALAWQQKFSLKCCSSDYMNIRIMEENAADFDFPNMIGTLSIKIDELKRIGPEQHRLDFCDSESRKAGVIWAIFEPLKERMSRGTNGTYSTNWTTRTETLLQASQFIDPYDLWVMRYQNDTPYSAVLNSIDMMSRQVFKHIQLRIPSMYFSRVSQVFRTAGIFEVQIYSLGRALDQLPDSSPEMRKFRSLWEDFIDQLIKEWETLNVIAALLLSAVLTLLQLDNATQPIT